MTPPHSGHFKFGDRPLRASLLLFVVQGYRWPRIPTLLPLSSLLAGSSSHLVVVSNNGSRIRVHPRTNSRYSWERTLHFADERGETEGVREYFTIITGTERGRRLDRCESIGFVHTIP